MGICKGIRPASSPEYKLEYFTGKVNQSVINSSVKISGNVINILIGRFNKIKSPVTDKP